MSDIYTNAQIKKTLEKTMELLLRRTNKLTEGFLYIDGLLFSDTLEDKWRNLTKEKKIPGETCIPAGRYRVVMDYSNRFKRVMPHILDVKYFEGVRIHAGNIRADTDGCILLGQYLQNGVLVDSKVKTEHFNTIVTEAIDRGEEVWITIDEQWIN